MVFFSFQLTKKSHKFYTNEHERLEPRNHLHWKEKSSEPNLHDFGFHGNFPGWRTSRSLYGNPRVTPLPMPHLPKSANIIQNHESLPGFIRIWWLDWLDIDWEWLTCFFCHFPCYPSQTMESRVRACLRMISWKMLICNRWYCSLKHDRYLLACFSSQYGAWDDSCNFFEWYLSSPFEFSEVLSVVHQKSNLFSRGPKFSWLVVSHILEFSPRFGEMIQYDIIFFKWVETTN